MSADAAPAPNEQFLANFQTGLSLKSQSRLVFRLKNLIHLERGDFLADLLDFIDYEGDDAFKDIR